MIRFSFDLGVRSMGYAVIELDSKKMAKKVLAGGVNIFPDGRKDKDQSPLAAERREARLTRRNRDRRKRQLVKVVNLLKSYGIYPRNEEQIAELRKLNPYQCRAEALENEKLAPWKLSRAIVHIAKRRGFRSNRKSQDKDETEFKKRIGLLTQKIKDTESSTLGNYLWREYQKDPDSPIRFVPGSENFPERAHYLEEFQKIKTKQYSSLSEEQWKELEGAIFYQRPLKNQIELVGNCPYLSTPENEIKRCRVIDPLYEKYLLIAEIANLRYFDEMGELRDLSKESLKKLYHKLKGKNPTAWKTVKKHLEISEECILNLEPNKGKLNGAPVTAHFSSKDRFGKRWTALSDHEKREILNLFDDENLENEELIEILKKKGYENAKDIVDRVDLSKLRNGYAPFSYQYLEKVMPYLEENIVGIQEANKALGIKEQVKKIETNGVLPYYGEVLVSSVVRNPSDKHHNQKYYKTGRIGNPTVHKVLNQFRKCLNDLVSQFGMPDDIYIEVTRDLKNSRKKKQEYEKRRKENEKLNNEIKSELGKLGLEINRDNILRLKLFKEMEKANNGVVLCPYSGDVIGLRAVFGPTVHVDHILPRSRTFDESLSNKVLCLREKNDQKGNKTPFEAFGGGNYHEILTRVKSLPMSKRKKFQENAVELYLSEDNWLERHLNDTAYISKISRKYAGQLVGTQNVITVPGMLTGSIRYALGLKKDRNDHRHHFVDAAVVGIFSRSYLKKIRRDNSRNKKVIIEPPYPDYRNHVEEIRENLKVRHTIDSNANVKWFEETAFGVLEEPIIIGEKQYKYTKRIEVEKIKPKKVELIVSNKIKKDLSELTEAQYEEYFSKYGIKKIKIYENKSNMFVIEHNGHKKAYPSEGNHSVEIWKIPKNKKLKEEGYCLLPRTYYEKARDPNLRPTPAAKKVFTIRKNSLIQSQIDPERIIYKVVTLDPTNNRIYARMLNVAANEGTKDKQITFRNFLKEKYRNVHVSEGGRVYFSPSPFDGKNYRIIKSGDLLLET